MFVSLTRLTFSMLLAIVPIATLAATVMSIEQPIQPPAAQTSMQLSADAAPSRFIAAGGPSVDLSSRVLAMPRPSDIALRPVFRPLAAGAPQTITLQVVPNTLVANSGATAVITATVYDITNDVVDGANLTGTVTAGRGSIGIFPATNLSGATTSTWTAADGSTVGTGTIEVITGTVTGSALITLTAGPPFTVTLQANPTNLSVGAASALTAAVVDQYGNPVADGTTVTFTTDLGNVVSPRPTTSGLATSSITSTVAGTAHVTATSDMASHTAAVVFTPGAPVTISLQANPTSLSVGAASALTATVVDQYGNRVANGTTVTFTTDLGSVLSPRPTTSGLATSSITSTMPGAAHITATSGGRSGFASVTFSVGAPVTVTLLASPTNLSVGAASALTATVVDQYGNRVANGTTVTFTTDLGNVLSPRSTTNGLATSSITSTVAGTAHITATSGGRSGFASVAFNAGSPAILTLSPDNATTTAGTQITYTAIATDTYGNLIGDVTAGTTFGISPGSGGTFAGNAITPIVKGTYTITGTNGAVATTSLVVEPSTFSWLSIEDAPNGTGAPINAYTMSVYDTLTAYAIAYDVYDNVIGPRSANWNGTGVVAGNIKPTNSSISTTFTAVVSGTGTITARTGGVTYATGPITVLAPVLKISKSDSPDPITPGAQLRYTIRYTNTSSFAAQGVFITETYPLNTSYAFASPLPTTGTNVWSLGNLAAGASSTIDVYVNVASQMPVGSVLTNTVRIGASRAATAIYTATTPVVAQPALSLNVADSIDPVRPGQEFVYTIQYRNDGNAPATGLRITETYPSQVTYVSATPPPSVGNNVWLTGTLSVGGLSRIIQVTVRVNSPAADGTTLNNRIAIDSNETAPFTITEPTLVTAPTLKLTKSANPAAPAANSLLTYTLQYTNSGTSYASGVVVTDAVPLNTVFQSCTAGCNLSGNTVTWNLGQVAQQSSGTLTMAVRVSNNLLNGTLLTNTARITSTEIATASASVTNAVSSAPNMRLSTSDGVTSAAANDMLTYQLAYTNTGISPAQSVVITDRIPANVNFAGCGACTAMSGGIYSFTLGTVDAAQSGVVTLSVRINSPLPAGLRTITNTASIRTATPGDNSSDNSAQDVDSISTVPAVALTPAYDASTPYPGKTITYTLRYTNTSLMDTTGVVISTTRAPYVSVIPTGWSLSGGADVYSVGNLAAGQSGTVAYVVVLSSTFTPATTAFSNTFLIHDGSPGNLPMASQNVTTTVGVPDLIIVSVRVPAAIAPNQKFTATLSIRNVGLGRACNPSNCGGFYLDTFVDPATQPPSYPFGGYGGIVPLTPITTTIAAGQVLTVNVTNIIFTPTQKSILYFKVDNYGCPGTSCLPVGSQGGLVPEFNENNNVAGPITVSRYAIYLPLIRKTRP